MPDLRTPPSSAGYSDIGGIIAPDSYKPASDEWFGLDEYAVAEASRRIRAEMEEAAKTGADPSLMAHINEAAGDWRLEFDSPYNRTYGYEQLGIPGVFTLLREWTWVERRAILERCHMAAERNPLAGQAIKLTTQFVVGKGLSITYQNPDVKAVVEDFRNDEENDIEAQEKEFCSDLMIDGELFVRFYDEVGTGRTVIASVQPWFVQYIKTDPNFRKRKLAYHIQGTLTDGYTDSVTLFEDVDPKDMLMVAINKASYEVRGRPELFRILPWLKAYKDWLEERARINRRQGSIYYHMQLKNSTPAQVSTARGAYRQPPAPGAIFVTNDNVNMTALGGNVRAGDAAEDGRTMKLMAWAGMGLPEYMFGEGRNSSKATASTQELPALANFSDMQDILLNRLWNKVYKRVIQNAVDAGVLPEMVTKCDEEGNPVLDANGQTQLIRAVDAFTCSFPDLMEPDPKNLADALAIHVASGWASNETAAGKAGYDYAVEQKKIQAEQAAMQAQTYNPYGGRTGGAVPPKALSGAPVPAQATNGDMTNGSQS